MSALSFGHKIHFALQSLGQDYSFFRVEVVLLPRRGVVFDKTGKPLKL